MSDFDQALSASIAAAQSKLEAHEQAQRAAQAAEREKAQSIADKFAEIEGRAIRFRSKHLETLFAKVQRQLGEAGFHSGGGGDTDGHGPPHTGVVGRTLALGERCSISATISYGLDKTTTNVYGQTSKGNCFLAYGEFDEATSLAWFESNLAKAVGKLLESGEVPKSNVVRHSGSEV